MQSQPKLQNSDAGQVPGKSFRSKCERYSRQFGYALTILLTALIAAEAMARIQDWVVRSEDPLASPTFEGRLYQTYATGTRGRPLGQFKCCQLNRFGFRGPEIEESPADGDLRIVILGASESFGSIGVEGSEFPAVVSDQLEGQGSYEVVNTSVIGMTLRSLNGYWNTWVSHFRPKVVLIYANPLFYLNEMGAPRNRQEKAAEKTPDKSAALTEIDQHLDPIFQSRFLEALMEKIKCPPWMQQLRDVRFVANVEAQHPADWTFEQVPQSRVEMYLSDLMNLIASIRAQRAVPVLVTHAIAADSVTDPNDHSILIHGRTFCPRASESVLVDFSGAVNQGIRELAQQDDVPLIDVAAELNGKPDLFVDLVHFNKSGAEAVGALISRFILQHFPTDGTGAEPTS